MGRVKDEHPVKVEAQHAVGLQQPAGDGKRGCSSHDPQAPHTQPRHRRAAQTSRAQEELPHRRRPSRYSGRLAHSPNGDDRDEVNSQSVMPPSSQRRLHRAVVIPTKARRRELIDEDEQLHSGQRHADRSDSPRHSRRNSTVPLSDTETESESDEASERSKIPESSPGVQEVQYHSDEADDEAPTRLRGRERPHGSRRREKDKEAYGEENSIRSHSDEETNTNHELVVRDAQSASQKLREAQEQVAASRSRHHRKSLKTPEGSKSHHTAHRRTRGGEPNIRSSGATTLPRKTSTVASSRSSTTSIPKRPTNVLSGLFGKQATTPKKHSKHGASGSGQKVPPVQPERVECVICMSDVSLRKAAHLKCDHWMCHTCLKRAFTLSVEDAVHMPPKCCTKDHIQIRHVEKLFDSHFKRTWNRKYVEYTTKNRLYCPAKRCGQFIKPSKIKKEGQGRRSAHCSHCDTKVCADCNNRWHKTVPCPQDDSINEFLAQAKEEGWQRCYSCKAMVELREGCNHMTCRCGAEFCMICGTKWKGCDCPWFNDAAIAADRRAHMNQQPASPREEVYHGAWRAMPRPEPLGLSGYTVAPLPMRTRTYDHHDEGHYTALDGGYAGYDVSGDMTMPGIGSSYSQNMGYHYDHGGSTSMINASVPPLTAPYDRVSDYVSAVSSARGVRERDTSVERRLRDRLAPAASPPSGTMIPTPLSPPEYSFVTRSAEDDASTGMPMVMQSYVYGGHAQQLNMGYSGMQHISAPSHMSAPGPDCYEPQATELNIIRRRRRAQERAAAEREAGASSRQRSSAAMTSMADVKSSSLAGLTGPGRGMDRVAEWSYHVSPGEPGSIVGGGR